MTILSSVVIMYSQPTDSLYLHRSIQSSIKASIIESYSIITEPSSETRRWVVAIKPVDMPLRHCLPENSGWVSRVYAHRNCPLLCEDKCVLCDHTHAYEDNCLPCHHTHAYEAYCLPCDHTHAYEDYCLPCDRTHAAVYTWLLY
jgi:hypothetical protein